MFPDREFSGILIGVAPGGMFQVECVSGYWETLRNGDELGGLEGSTRKQKSRGEFRQDLLSPLGVGTQSEERPKHMVSDRTGIRLEDWT